MATKKVTYNDIAQYTNFSKTTISRFFNNPNSVTVENRNIIRNALKELDYKENKLAKALAKGKSEFVGIILPNMNLHYYTEILNKILLSYEKFGYKFLVFLGNENKEIEKDYINELLSFQIEGLIILSHTIPSEELAEFDIPLVTIEREDAYVNSINSDNYIGGVKATQHLIDLGCQILIHINSKFQRDTPAISRVDGFMDTCEKNNKDFELKLGKFGSDFNSINKVIKQFFEEIEENYSGLKKGIFFSNDTYENLFLNQIFRKYGKLPEDYKLVGFDDSPIATEGILPMTTVAQKIEKVALNAMELLDELIVEHKKKKSKHSKELIHRQIEPELVIRETT